MIGKTILIASLLAATILIGCKDTEKKQAKDTGSDTGQGTDTATDTGTGQATDTDSNTVSDSVTDTVSDADTGSETDIPPGPCSGVACNQSPINACSGTLDLNVFNDVGWCENGGCVYGGRFEQCEAGVCESGICTNAPCQGVRCIAPPTAICVDVNTLKVYNEVGYCTSASGVASCTYASREIACTAGCQDGRCGEDDPCARTICNAQPARYCDQESSLQVWDTLPRCQQGQCLYAMQSVICAGGCESGCCAGEDVCGNMRCNTPPASYCLNDTTLRAFGGTSTCDEGACIYKPNDIACASGCVGGQCVNEPCAGVVCNQEPASHCEDASTLTFWDGNPGTCVNGVCAYNVTKAACPGGCADGRCASDPCMGVYCNDPPASHCSATGGLVSYQSPGTCEGEGECAYKKSEIVCLNGCARGSCIASTDRDTDTDSDTGLDNDTDSDTDTDTDTAEIGDQSGTVGYSEMSPDGDFDREKVLVDGEEYIISNNNWGDPENTNLILAYFNNSFEIVEGSASGAPAAFPTIYIGANGETGNGIASTSATDNLPMRVSDISSANTSFAWSGSTSSFTTTYDVWFANSSPTEMYDDGIDGFMMIWVHDPSDAPPIGSSQGSESVAGETWDVWVGPRGEGPAGYNDATVVSFVAGSDIRSKSFDLKDFMDAASGYGISSSMYLTDVFFGFEIWNGGAGGNLSVDEFTCKVE